MHHWHIGKRQEIKEDRDDHDAAADAEKPRDQPAKRTGEREDRDEEKNIHTPSDLFRRLLRPLHASRKQTDGDVTTWLPPGQRVYAIGDIHGLSDALGALLDLVDEDVARRPAAAVTEVFLGDYVDRGPNSAAVVARLLAPAAPGRRRICLKGNHEDAMLAAFADARRVPQWLTFGGDATLASYGVRGPFEPRHARAGLHEALPTAHYRFLSALPTHAQIGGLYFAHAGIRPEVPLESQDEEDLIWIREDFLDFAGALPAHVVHGHTPVPSPDHRRWRTNVDTGAVYGGALTAAVFEGAAPVRFLSVPGSLR